MLGHLEVWRLNRPTHAPDILITTDHEVEHVLERLEVDEVTRLRNGLTVVTNYFPKEYFEDGA